MTYNTRNTPITKIKTASKRTNSSSDSNSNSSKKVKTLNDKLPRFNSNVRNAIISIRPTTTKLYDLADEYSYDNHREIGKLFSRYYNDPKSSFTVKYLNGFNDNYTGKELSMEARESARFVDETNYYVNARLQNDTSYSIAAQIQNYKICS